MSRSITPQRGRACLALDWVARDLLSKKDPSFSEIAAKGPIRAIVGSGQANSTWTAGIVGFGAGRTANSVQNSSSN